MNFPSSVVSQFPSCTKSLTIRLENTVVKLKQNNEVTINSVEVRDLPVWINDVFIKKASNLFIIGKFYFANDFQKLFYCLVF